jgi:heterodisulfide reductase subunit A-like polyferredoxin
VCPIDLPDEYDKGLSGRKAIFKQYAQAIPGAFGITKRGTAPCKAACPAHVSIQGYIALINQGKYREALELFKQDHPFPGVCGRVCHRPCEDECTRNDVDQPLAIRELHRFMADYEKEKGEYFIPTVPEEKRDEKVAVIGSGPSGLTAAYYLLQQGYNVTLFEKLPEAGGMLRMGIPEYRLPRDILTGEIEVIKRMGAKIECNTVFGKDITLNSLKSEGYSACFLAIGLHGGKHLGVENEDAVGVLQGVDFLRDVALGKKVDIGEDVIVVGGGNVAMDAALTAKRKGARKVTLVCLEKREEMPALEHEIKEALEGDIKIVNSFGPKSFFIDKGNNVSGIEFKTCTAVFDENGRFSPIYDDNACQPFFGDTVIIAIGQSMDVTGIKEMGIPLSQPGGLKADPVTLQTPMGWVFAGGDAFYGPKSVVDAVASGKEAAESIHRYINGLDLLEGRDKKWEFVKPDPSSEEKKIRTTVRCLDPVARECNFLEVSFGYNQDEAEKEADRCLKCGICSECYQCVSACLAGAVDHEQQSVDKEIQVGSVILSSGVDLYNPVELAQFYHYGTNPNVMTSLEFERILSASGPTMGRLIRPSDRKEPQRIAWLQCVGSRDINRCGNGYCSSVCCMYAIKDAMIAKEHSHGDLDAVVFYMDIRSYGKDYEKYYLRAKEREGVRFVKSRIHTIYDDPVTRNLKLVYADETGKMHKEDFDMIVLSVGLQVGRQSVELAQRLSVDLNEYNFIRTEPFEPVTTSRPGVYVCGIFQGPKDIPSSVTEASAAAGAAGLDVAEARGMDIRTMEIPEEMDVTEEDPRIGVFVCNCGINIGGVVDVPGVQEYAATLDNVVFTDNNLFTCSQDTQEKIKEKIKEEKLNRVVVASCSPKTHAPMFMETLESAGLNKYLFEMANIRNQNSWVHINNPDIATEKAKDLVRMAVARAGTLRPLKGKIINVDKRALVIGGGIAGMNAALDISGQGFNVIMIEKEKELGGMARRLHHTIEGADIRSYLRKVIDQVTASPKIEVLTNTRVIGFDGFQGNFTTEVAIGSGRKARLIEHGVIVVATGANEYQPQEFLYGRDKRVVTQVSLTDYLEKNGAGDLDSVVMIQCVGSRTEENPNCSRICCQSAVKNALLIKKKNPETNVYILCRDIRTYGLMEDFYSKARKLGVIFVRFDKDTPPTVTSGDDGVLVTVRDHILCRVLEIRADLLALSVGMTASDTEELGKIMKLNRNPEGFFIEAHVKLRPVDMPGEAVFLCGTAHAPKLISETIAQSKAAASRAVTFLAKDEIQLSAITAKVDVDYCVKCLTCVRSCPYGVPKFNVESGEIQIDEAMCHGCGVCAAVCPRQTIGLSYYEDDQIICKIDALLA